MDRLDGLDVRRWSAEDGALHRHLRCISGDRHSERIVDDRDLHRFHHRGCAHRRHPRRIGHRHGRDVGPVRAQVPGPRDRCRGASRSGQGRQRPDRRQRLVPHRRRTIGRGSGCHLGLPEVDQSDPSAGQVDRAGFLPPCVLWRRRGSRTAGVLHRLPTRDLVGHIAGEPEEGRPGVPRAGDRSLQGVPQRGPHCTRGQPDRR